MKKWLLMSAALGCVGAGLLADDWLDKPLEGRVGAFFSPSRTKVVREAVGYVQTLSSSVDSLRVGDWYNGYTQCLGKLASKIQKIEQEREPVGLGEMQALHRVMAGALELHGTLPARISFAPCITLRQAIEQISHGCASSAATLVQTPHSTALQTADNSPHQSGAATPRPEYDSRPIQPCLAHGGYGYLTEQDRLQSLVAPGENLLQAATADGQSAPEGGGVVVPLSTALVQEEVKKGHFSGRSALLAWVKSNPKTVTAGILSLIVGGLIIDAAKRKQRSLLGRFKKQIARFWRWLTTAEDAAVRQPTVEECVALAHKLVTAVE